MLGLALLELPNRVNEMLPHTGEGRLSDSGCLFGPANIMPHEKTEEVSTSKSCHYGKSYCTKVSASRFASLSTACLLQLSAKREDAKTAIKVLPACPF